MRFSFSPVTNPTTMFLTLSDVVGLGSDELLRPVFALFVVSRIPDSGPAVVGIAMASYFLAKSVAQLPVAHLLDRIAGERDDFSALFFGRLAMAAGTALYLLVSQPVHLYLVQAFLGLAVALYLPSYLAIFTRHTRKAVAGQTWGLRYTMVDLMGATAAVIGGYLASSFGFAVLIAVYAGMQVVSALLVLPIRSRTRRPDGHRRGG
ncbi:MFS transporter [Candidatus Uhrbacteria bacterium]|nr:MFS transporter [Candidatus Uhrbacteria bacterium]